MEQRIEVEEVEGRPHNCTSNRVGPGSPKGPRWFVSFSPQHQIVMRPHGGFDDATGLPLQRKGKTLAFLSKMKPRGLWGTGERSTKSNGIGDRNEGILWGVYKTEDQKEIDFLRTRESYSSTAQDNELNNSRPNLKEYDFDPTPRPDGKMETGKVERRTGKPEAVVPATEGAPDDDHETNPGEVKPGLAAPGSRRKF